MKRIYHQTNSLIHKNIDLGSDKKVVFLSGLGLAIRQQREGFIRRFVLNQGVSYLALDYTKFTDNSSENEGFRIRESYDRTMDLMTVLPDKKIFLVGSCYGGLMALKIAERLPQKIAGVVAFSPPYEIKEFPWMEQADNFLEKRINALERKKAKKYMIEKMILFRQMAMYAFRTLGKEQIKSSYMGPMSIFHGENDRLIPAENSLAIQRKFKNPNSKVIVVPTTGHTLNTDFEMKEPIRILKEYLKD